jgi:hypothetical protein
MITWSDRTTQKGTGQITEFNRRAIFGKGTEDTNSQCKLSLGIFCCNDGREELSSMVLPIILEKLWPALVTVFGLPEQKDDRIIVKGKE